MNLIEHTTDKSIQVYAEVDRGKDIHNNILGEEENNKVSIYNLIKNNLIQRALKSLILQGITREEFDSDISPNVKVRVLEIKNPESDKKIVAGITNIPASYEDMHGIPPKLKMMFEKTSEIEDYPSDKLLSNKLEDLLYSDLETPLDIDFLVGDIISEETLYSNNVELEDLDKYSRNFYDTVYSSTKVLWKEKLGAAYLLNVHDIHKSGKLKYPLSNVFLSRITKDIKDLDTRKYVIELLRKFSNSPESIRISMVNEAKNQAKGNLKSGQVGIDKKTNKPIKTWKLLVSVGFIILTILAIMNRDKIKLAYQVSKDSKDFNKSGFSIFYKTLFSSQGKSYAEKYINGKNNFKSGSSTLDELDAIKKEAIAKKARGAFNMKSASGFFRG